MAKVKKKRETDYIVDVEGDKNIFVDGWQSAAKFNSILSN